MSMETNQHQNLQYIQVKKKKKPFLCSFCKKGYQTEANLKKHTILCEVLNQATSNTTSQTLFIAPSQTQLYKIIQELTIKQKKMEEKIDQSSNTTTCYYCNICNTKPDQLSHHKAHLKTQKHIFQKTSFKQCIEKSYQWAHLGREKCIKMFQNEAFFGYNFCIFWTTGCSGLDTPSFFMVCLPFFTLFPEVPIASFPLKHP